MGGGGLGTERERERESETRTTASVPKQDHRLISFHRLTVVLFCSSKKGLIPKIRMLCFAIMNSVI